VIALPYVRQPLPDFSYACSVATVLDVDGATTVITRVAEPVENARGSPAGAGCAGVLGRFDVLAGSAARVGLFSGWSEVRACDDDGTAVGVVAAVVVGMLGAGVSRCPAGAEVQAARLSSAAMPTAQLRRRNATRLGCHATPMRIRGCAAGVSHFMIETRCACEIATQPAVALPSVTCRKNALPLPWRTPPGALRVL
jgi:hypothetical protein